MHHQKRQLEQILAFHIIFLLVPFSNASSFLQCYKCYGKDCIEPESTMEVCTSATNVCYARLEKNFEIRDCSNAVTECDLDSVKIVRSEMMTMRFPGYVCKLCNGSDLCNNRVALRRNRNRRKQKGKCPRSMHLEKEGRRYDKKNIKGNVDSAVFNEDMDKYEPPRLPEEDSYWSYDMNLYPNMEETDIRKWMTKSTGTTRLDLWRGYEHARLVTFSGCWIIWGFLLC